MKNTKLLSILSELGLSQNEAKVYVAALSLGPTSVLKISEAAAIKRTTVYSVVQSLKQQGLMRIELKGFKELFVAEDPEKLEAIFAARREKLKLALPEFSALYNLKGGQSTIKYYEGLQAIKGIYEDLLLEVGPQEDYLVISDMEQWRELDQEYFSKFWERRYKARIKPRILLTNSEAARQQQKAAPAFEAQVRMLPEGTKLPTNLIVTGKKVVIIQMQSPLLAIVIENPSVTKMHKEMFELIWNSGKN